MTEEQFSIPPIKLAEAALSVLGRSPSELSLVRVGTNAVFTAGDVMVRVSPANYDRELLREQVELANWLVSQRFPTASPVGDLLVVQDHPVTLWQRIAVSRQPSMRDLGRLTRDFHDLTDSYSGSLPEWQPLGRLGDRLDRLEPDSVVSRADCQLLHRWKTVLVKRVEELPFALQSGPLHGDIHVGNVVASESACYLVDFDRIARGPREWDLADPLAGVVLFSCDERLWDTFVADYGYDLRDFPGADELVQLRGLFMLSWLLTLERSPRIEEEIRTRMEYFRDPTGTYPKWSPV